MLRRYLPEAEPGPLRCRTLVTAVYPFLTLVITRQRAVSQQTTWQLALQSNHKDSGVYLSVCLASQGSHNFSFEGYGALLLSQVHCAQAHAHTHTHSYRGLGHDRKELYLLGIPGAHSHLQTALWKKMEIIINLGVLSE